MTQLMAAQVAGLETACAAPRPAPATDRPVTRPLRPLRPGRGSGRATGPTLRPLVASPAPAMGRHSTPAAHSCVVPAPEMVPASISSDGLSWRLTDRGVAVVLVAGLMIMVAALIVMGLTATKVTGDRYQATVSMSLPR